MPDLSNVSKSKTETLQDLFLKGNFSRILQVYKDQSQALKNHDEAYVISALSVLGKTRDAKELFDANENIFSETAKAVSAFYLAIEITRKSHYKQARILFKKQYKAHANSKLPEVSFYAHQGVGFYLYFIGQFYRSEFFATRALGYALRAKNNHLVVLAKDLLAHSLIQTGRVFEGLNLLQEASDLAASLGNTALVQATEISTLLYEAEYGHRPHEILPDLESHLTGFKDQDSYSKSKVALSLAKQLILRGQWARAEQILNAQAPVIFASEHRRQEITLNLLWAELAFLRGDLLPAWQHLRSARHRLHSEVDKTFAVQILNLEIKVLEEQLNPLALEKQRELEILQARFDRRNAAKAPAKESSDFLEKIFSEVQKSPLKAPEILYSSGYWSLFYKTLPLEKGQSYIVLGLIKNAALLFSEDGIETARLSNFSLRIIDCLRGGVLNKADLVQQLWGYEYHPLRHDPLVYSAMSALRKSLGENQTWIETTDTGYKLANHAHIYNAQKNEILEKVTSSQVEMAPDPAYAELNYRQIQALEYLQSHRFLNTRDYKALFKTTEITASRDLSDLCKQGHILRIGFGRSTQYSLKGDRS